MQKYSNGEEVRVGDYVINPWKDYCVVIDATYDQNDVTFISVKGYRGEVSRWMSFNLDKITLEEYFTHVLEK